MSESAGSARSIIPAQLNFLAIYSPILGPREDNQKDQIVFHYSRAEHERRRSKRKDALSREQIEKLEHDQLRQVGLAQGMLNFAGGFSNGSPLESVETDRHRIILTELEQEWWILASIDLIRLPNSRHSSADHTSSDPQYEYSSREVSPPSLLIQQLRRAYRIFLLHHSHSLSDLYVRLSRQRFCDTLAKYWTNFAMNWDVLLHGNPAVDAFGAIKLAAGGELGIGVGEEEWGSGEREVLEGLIRNTEGMLDLIVSRYGSALDERSDSDRGVPHIRPWLARGASPEPADGLVFSGIDHLAKRSLRDILFWTDEIYQAGEEAYGIRTNPGSTRRKSRRRKRPDIEEEGAEDKNIKDGHENEELPVSDTSKEIESRAEEAQDYSTEERRDLPAVPPPIVSAAESSLKRATNSAQKSAQVNTKDKSAVDVSTSFGGSDVWMKYLTLGYGSSWGRARSTAPSDSSALKNQSKGRPTAENAKTDAIPNPVVTAPVAAPDHLRSRKPGKSAESHMVVTSGRYLIGLTEDLDVEEEPVESRSQDEEGAADSDWSSRLSVRTLHVSVTERAQSPPSRGSSPTGSTTARGRSTTAQEELSTRQTKLKVIVYAHAPFLYTFCFDQECPLLTYPSFFHDLHRHLSPLHEPLRRSTSPSNVAARLQASLLQSPSSSFVGNSIYDFVYSPSNITIRSSVPNIPSPGTLAAEGISSSSHIFPGSANLWTRVEALSVHSRILDLIADTRAQLRSPSADSALTVKPGERERNLKTSRGWWIVWTKVATTSNSPSVNDVDTYRHDSKKGVNTDSETSEDEADNVGASSAIVSDSIHSSQIQSGYTSTVRGGELERTTEQDLDYKEAILIRRATDAASAGGRKSMFRARSPPSGSASIWSQGMQGMQGMSSSAFAPFARLAGSGTQARSTSETTHQAPTANSEATESRSIGGIGVDVPKYVEGLLSLSR